MSLSEGIIFILLYFFFGTLFVKIFLLWRRKRGKRSCDAEEAGIAVLFWPLFFFLLICLTGVELLGKFSGADEV